MKNLNKRGLSLVEVVIATLILVTTTGLTYTAFITSTRWIKQSYASAPSLARQVAESFTNAVRADTWNDSGTEFSVGSSGSMASEGDEVEWTVSQPLGAESYKRVKVEVSWPS